MRKNWSRDKNSTEYALLSGCIMMMRNTWDTSNVMLRLICLQGFDRVKAKPMKLREAIESQENKE